MNPLPLNGTKYLGGVMIFLGGLLVNQDILALLNAWKYGPAVLVILSGLLTMLRGFQNSANNTAMAAAPPPLAPAQSANQAVMKALWLLLLALPLSLMLPGCATTPSQTTTFEQIADTAAGLDDTAVKTADSLLLAHVITTVQLRNLVAVTDKIAAAINVARASFNAGNSADAATAIAKVSTELLAAQACLAGPPASLTTCLAAIQ
jgi:hypothetical protein